MATGDRWRDRCTAGRKTNLETGTFSLLTMTNVSNYDAVGIDDIEFLSQHFRGYQD